MLVLDSTRLIIPQPSQKAVLRELHRAHSGMQKTYATALKLYYWPGMKNCIRTFVSTCKICQKFASSLPRQIVIGNSPSSAKEPMASIGIDIVDAIGKKWLAVVCRFSGYARLIGLKKLTQAAVIEHLIKLFHEFGFPRAIRSVNGPQFRSEFADFCKQNTVIHETSAPYNRESNGLAEAAVNNLKSIILRCKENDADLRSAIATWRNMTRSDGSSPSEIFFNRTQKQNLPLLPLDNQPINEAMERCPTQKAMPRQKPTFNDSERVFAGRRSAYSRLSHQQMDRDVTIRSTIKHILTPRLHKLPQALVNST